MLSFLLLLWGLFSGAQASLITEEPISEKTQEEHSNALRNSVTLVWWNLGRGVENFKLTHNGSSQKNLPYSPLDHNIRQLIHSIDRPSFLVLSEFNPKIFEQKTLQEICRRYPYSHVFFYGPSREGHSRAILFLSVYPIQSTASAPLAWTRPQLHHEDLLNKITTGRDDFHQRTYNRATVLIDGKPLHLLLTHLTQIWSDLMAFKPPTKSALESSLRFMGVPLAWTIMSLAPYGEAAHKIVFSDRENPTQIQAEHLKILLSRDLGHKLESEPVLMVGDFNIPDHLHGLTPHIYGILSSLLDPVPWGEGPDFTFPAPSAKTWEKIKKRIRLDHAFTNTALKDSSVWALPIVGSDHLPILVELPIHKPRRSPLTEEEHLNLKPQETQFTNTVP